MARRQGDIQARTPRPSRSPRPPAGAGSPRRSPAPRVRQGEQPLHKGGGIVGAGVHHRVPGAVVGQIGALPVGIKGVDQHLHAGQAAFRDEAEGVFVQIPQILGDSAPARGRRAAPPPAPCRGPFPSAPPGRPPPRRGCTSRCGSPGSGRCAPRRTAGQVNRPAAPPGKAGLPVVVPVVEGVAPVLALVGEGVGGAPRPPRRGSCPP